MDQDSSESATTRKLVSMACLACGGKLLALEPSHADSYKNQLHKDWRVCGQYKSLSRRFEFKGYAKAVSLANLCAWLADREGHHPDIAFGWGYCVVNLTTHDIGALSINDFIWAAKLDDLLK